MSERYVVVDIETTGNSAKDGTDRITQFAAVVIEHNEITEIFSTFVNPDRDIPPFIVELTGISRELVQHAPRFRDVAPMIVELLQDSCFVAHNVHFDWNFLQEELRQAGLPQLDCPNLDTVELARILLPTAESHKLGDLAKVFALEHDQPHRADSDAMVTAQLLMELQEKLSRLPLQALQAMYELSHGFKSDIGRLLSPHIMKKLQSGKEEEDWDVFRSLALRTRSYRVQMDQQEPLSFEEAIHHVETVLRHRPGYEKREGQEQMIQEVYHALAENRYSLIEAGTGVGKTLAYLLPALVFSKEKSVPVVVSTHTVQLQQQVIDKEIPLLQRLLPFTFEVSLLKGRKHYICLHKFEQALREEDHNYDSILTKAKIVVWLLETETGDVDELNLPSGGRLLWERICCDQSSRSKQNPWSSRCFYERAKHRALFADLVITNHTLLLQDLQQEESLLASCEHVILDEAHHIEETASQSLGRQFSCMQFQLLLSRIGTLDTNEVLFHVYELAKEYGISEGRSFRLLHRLLKELKLESDELFRMLRAYIFERSRGGGVEGNVRLLYRYEAGRERGRLWRAIQESASRVSALYDRLLPLLNEAVQELHRHPYCTGLLVAGEFRRLVGALQQSQENLTRLLLEQQEGSITWMETEAKGTIHTTVLYAQPADVSEKLADQLFARKKSVILTSATLTVHDSFQYMIDSLGLTDFHPSTLSVASPFAYEKQVKLMIPTDLPHVKRVSAEEYAAAVAEQLARIATVTGGRMLVLFTSYDMLRRTHAVMKEREELAEFALLAQGVNSGSRTRITKHFRQFDKAILFGTNSFWEGVDIPGEDLSCLIMVRLPFAPPDHPLAAAKAALAERQGKNPFLEVSLPQAIIRFKQGFGRLIRTKQDSGTFFVLDRRITNSFYGKRFVESIPKVPLYEKPLEELLKLLQET
ncbi:ATP-dependent DNA helicase DinG [Ectobacillus ponti]|uniref:3'-5' exonuclease DinG n=1 Tax=Ectobacillus ponti TaxID=2961894 RepID=A0AA41X9I3_9BACI|nr:ATP-dependent DNA helicase DinG [Ectobacillus ponti]